MLPLHVVGESPLQMAKRIMSGFGYANFTPEAVRQTASKGWEFRSGTTLLVVDAKGLPRTLKVGGVPFEQASPKVLNARIGPLLRRYRLSLIPGRWEADSFYRYVHRPVLHGIAFLDAGDMVVQVSKDGKRVIEWFYNRPLVLPPVPAPGRLLTRSQALDTFVRHAQPQTAGVPNASVRAEGRTLRLGWIDPRRPRLAYECEVTFLSRGSMGTKGVGSKVRIDARTGEPIASR